MTCRRADYAPALLFGDANCMGPVVRIDLADHPVEGKQYRNEEWLDWAGLPNDWLSSVMVPPGYKLTLFEHNNYHGETRVYEGQGYDVLGQMPCVTISDFDDEMSSLIYERTVDIRLITQG